MITIFTPTYNRAYRLKTLYQSLQRQSCMDFEWIVVDDGSKDNTRELVEKWSAEEKSFAIRYFWKENGGKHTAINLGVEKAVYDWFFVVDSDDFVTDDAVQKIHQWISTIKDESVAGVSGTKCYPDGKIIGQNGAAEAVFIDARNNERKKYRLQGDKAEVYKTDILRRYPFPAFEGERFLSEGAVWNHIAVDGYVIRWFKDPITICEYLADGLTALTNNTDIEVQNFQGFTYCTRLGLRAYSGIEKVRIICRYINKAKKKGLGIQEIANRIKRNKVEILLLSIPVYLRNLLKKRKKEK